MKKMRSSLVSLPAIDSQVTAVIDSDEAPVINSDMTPIDSDVR